jgi:hypothetical protein
MGLRKVFQEVKSEAEQQAEEKTKKLENDVSDGEAYFEKMYPEAVRIFEESEKGEFDVMHKDETIRMIQENLTVQGGYYPMTWTGSAICKCCGPIRYPAEFKGDRLASCMLCELLDVKQQKEQNRYWMEVPEVDEATEIAMAEWATVTNLDWIEI